jgi:hypothetical protein
MTFCLVRDDRVILAASLCSEPRRRHTIKPVRLCQTNWGCNNRMQKSIRKEHDDGRS